MDADMEKTRIERNLNLAIRNQEIVQMATLHAPRKHSPAYYKTQVKCSQNQLRTLALLLPSTPPFWAHHPDVCSSSSRLLRYKLR